MASLRGIWTGALVAVLAGAAPARADVIAQGQLGFVSRNVIVVAGTPAAVWKRLVSPSAWWSGEHTFSGDPANLSLDPVAGGCFCEKLPAEEGDAARPVKAGAAARLTAAHPAARGGVEHMRVVFVDRTKALRMVGGLGPLQSEAVSATLTVTLSPVDGGTRVIFEYVVGGYMRYPADKIAPAVDTVMGNQLVSLAKLFGPVEAPAAAQRSAPPAPVDGAAPPASGGRGLDRKGLLLPRGKVWSLPANEAAPPPPPEPAPTIAPLPTMPLPQDVSVQDGTPIAAPAKPKPRAGAKKPIPKSASKPATGGDEPSRDSIDSALDAAFPAPSPTPAPN